MEPGVRVQRLGPGDWSRLRDLRVRALTGDGRAFYGDLAEERARPPAVWRDLLDTAPDRATFAGVLPGDRDAGLLTCGPPTWDTTADPRHFDLSAMWVAPQARGTGLATALVERAVAHARAFGATAVTLWVYDTNPRATAFFTRCGFVPTGRTGTDGDRAYAEHRLDL